MAEHIQLDGGPGKVVPRLIRDLLDYDSMRKRKYRKNLLTDPAPIYKTDGPSPIRRLDRDCQHNLYRKDEQISVPSGDHKPAQGDFYKSASYCAKCLCHFDVLVSLTSSEAAISKVCQAGTDYPMHHFVLCDKRYRALDDPLRLVDSFDPWIEYHTWYCSAPFCPASVDIKITPARLDKQKRELLSDAETLQQRGKIVISNEPARYENAGPLSPGEALSILRQYVIDALRGETKRVAARNKKFLLAFANDCDEIFEWLGFRAVVEPKTVDDPTSTDRFWILPTLEQLDLTEHDKYSKHLLQDVYCELCQLLSDQSDRDKLTKKIEYYPLAAMRDLNSIFGITDYVSKQIKVDLDVEEHPYYGSLGATSDFPDELIVFAYERQLYCDPANTAYYFECLKDIATGRARNGGAELLQMEVVKAESLGQQTQSAIDSAYKYFDLVLPTSDEHIIGTYNSRIESAPRQSEEARACLAIIGSSRQSSKIIEIASSKAMDYEEAANYLGVGENPHLDVDTLRAAVTILEIDGDKEKILRAVKALAEKHEDFAMKMYLQELETGAKPELSLQESYARLQISDPNIPDDTVLTYFQQLSADAAPGSKSSFLEALSIIASHRQSYLLKEKVKNPDGKVEAPKGQPDQPVGLANIGNTCYLNSLLQYYYTVKAVREVVMNFDLYKMPVNSETLKKKRVGGRAVKENEILRAQEFVPLLANLYKQLKVAPTRSVRPTQELAEMTLYSAEAEEQFRRASMSGIEPSTMSIAAVMNDSNNAAIGPQLPPAPTRPAPLPAKDGSGDVEMIDLPAQETEEMDDAVSDTTLVDQDHPVTVEAFKESDTEMKDATAESQPARFLLATAKEPVVSVAELSADDEAIEVDQWEDISEEKKEHREQTPDKPPVPPRNKPAPIDTSGRNNKRRKLEFGAQQDVTEVIGNLMFNLQCAIKPTGFDPVFGEQIDTVKETFYGSNATYLQKGNNVDRKIEPWANLIVFPDTEGSRTLYEALDVVFDEQTVEIDNTNAKQWASVNQLPPVLQIQIQRTQYDPVLGASKNQNKIEFDETIFLDRYMDSKKVLQRRRESGKRKSQLAELIEHQKILEEKRYNMSKAEVYDNAKNLLTSIQETFDDDFEIINDIPEILGQRSLDLKSQIDSIEKQKQEVKAMIREDFTDMRDYRYVLQAVFIHKGGSGSGHHWVYIYDFKNDVWREYNDERVEIVKDRQKVFGNEGWSATDPRPATAHYLVYVRDDQKNDLVDAVCREMDEVAAPGEVAQPHWDNTMIVDSDKSQAMHVEYNQEIEQQVKGTGSAWSSLERDDEEISPSSKVKPAKHPDWSAPL